MIPNSKRILLDRIQTYCEEWWGVSSQFHNLHAIFEQDGTPEGQQISILIKKSQIVLCVTIGFIASLSIEVQNSSDLERVVLNQTFRLPKLIIQDAYLIQMKLTCIILHKMDKQERLENEFAVTLQERVNRFKAEHKAGTLLPSPTKNGETSQNSNGSDHSAELESLLTSLLQNQTNLLQ